MKHIFQHLMGKSRFYLNKKILAAIENVLIFILRNSRTKTLEQFGTLVLSIGNCTKSLEFLQMFVVNNFPIEEI